MPLAHGADRGVAWQCTHAGGRIGFARQLQPLHNSTTQPSSSSVRSDSDYEVLLGDLAAIQPRFFLGMSHLWTDLHADYAQRLHTLAEANRHRNPFHV